MQTFFFSNISSTCLHFDHHSHSLRIFSSRENYAEQMRSILSMGRLLNRNVCIQVFRVMVLMLRMKLTEAITPERALPVNLLDLHLRINTVTSSPAKVFTAMCARVCCMYLYTVIVLAPRFERC